MYEPNFTIFSFMCVDTPFMDNLVETGIGIFFLCIGNSQRRFYNTQSKSDWPFNTQSRVLQAHWFILENAEETTLSMMMINPF